MDCLLTKSSTIRTNTITWPGSSCTCWTRRAACAQAARYRQLLNVLYLAAQKKLAV